MSTKRKKAPATVKINDTDPAISVGSRLDTYWKQIGFNDFHKLIRPGQKTVPGYRTPEDLQRMLDNYKLKAVGFGNWVTQEDRNNYVAALNMAFYDLNKVLRFDNNIGLNKKISVSFGSRGLGRALAHFEPHTFIINLTRYIDDPAFPKMARFIGSGGMGSLAHEYGHALDYYFGMYVDKAPGVPALSGGRFSINSKAYYASSGNLRTPMNNLMNAIAYDCKNYVRRVHEATDGSDYYLRRNEIFARAFEVYVSSELRTLGITNKLLTETKYTAPVYLTKSELERVRPHFSKLLTAMRTVQR